MNTIIIDIDGICLDPIPRLNRCKQDDGTIDWNRAFRNAEVIQDPMLPNANAKVMLIVKQLIDRYPSIHVIYLTGRSMSCREATLSAMGVMGFTRCHQQTLLMRKLGDTRPDAIIKSEYIDEMTEDTFIAAIDDDYNGTLGPMYIEKNIPHYKSLDAYIEYLSQIL